MEVLHDSYKIVHFGPQQYKVPKEWDVLNIKDTSTLKGRIGWQGLTTKEYLSEGEYFLITGTDFKDGKIDWKNCHFVTKDRFDQDTKIQIKENDLLITKDGTIGKVSIVNPLPNKPGTLNSGVFVLRPINNEYIPMYMYHYLNSFFFRAFISQIKAGSTIAHLYQKDFEKYTFLAPPLPEQQKIAKILSTVDEQISATERIIEKSKELKKGLMQKLFSEGIGHTEFKDTKIGRIPKDWEVVKLSELAIIKGRIGFRGYTRADLVKKGKGALTIGAKHIDKSNHLDFSIPEYISWEKYHESPEIKVEPGHILIVQRGSIGKIALVESLPEPSTINPSMVLVKEISSNKKFLFYWLTGYYMQNHLLSETSSTSIPMISQKQINNFLIPQPSSSEQQKIAEILSEADTKIEKEEKYKLELEQLKKGLMQQLLTGQKRVKV